MQRKFFIKRFVQYFLLLLIPTIVVFVLAFGVVNSQIDDQLVSQSENTLSNVNTNLYFVISNVAFQNDQLAKDSYMLLSLKKLLRGDRNISFSDAIYLRNIKAMLNSITQSYTYVQSVYLYLDGYSRFFSSDGGVVDMETDRAWLERYQSMDEEQENYIENRILESREVLTVYERMLLLNGVVVMNIDVEKYESLLDTILQDNDETVLYVNTDNQVLFAWNDKDNLADSFDLEEFEQNGKQDSWMKVGSGKYLIRTEYNQRYDLNLVSFIPKREKMTVFWQMIKLFTTIFVINALVMLFLAYATTKRTFNQLDYMIQVFHDAEGGIYPSSPKKDVEDEYDVIMNNIIYLFLNTIKLNEELNQKQHEQEVAELTALQLQINPHFLFNTLQTIQLEIRKNCPGSERSGKALDDLSDILKYALADPLETISLREEIEYLKRYVSIQQFRFGDKFIVYYEIEEDLMEFQVFRLMLQPLVENSILHGVRHKEGRGYIKLKIFKRGGRVNFRVIDNGCGMTKEECEKLRNSMNTLDIHHIGLNNVNSRLVLRFGKEASLIIRSKKWMGSAMEFSLPDN